MRIEWFPYCEECGISKIDEDGCCPTCGAELSDETDNTIRASIVAKHELDALLEYTIEIETELKTIKSVDS